MSYLIDSDFKKLIQVDNLSQIIGNDTSLLLSAKLDAEQIATEYLQQKYDCTKEFQSTDVWDRTRSYKAGERFYLNASAYAPTNNYAVNDLTLQNGNVYICTHITTGTFDGSKWALLSPQFTLFYAVLPYPEFNYDSVYVIGSHVFWKDKTYTALQPTVIPSHVSSIQYPSIADKPLLNPAPDKSVQVWGAGTDYSVAAGTLPIDTAFYTQGDNRNRVLVNTCMAIALYNLHKRIAPRNIPELRVKDYDDSIAWLKDTSQGKFITSSLPIIQPKQGGRVRYGGNVKLNNQL